MLLSPGWLEWFHANVSLQQNELNSFLTISLESSIKSFLETEHTLEISVKLFNKDPHDQSSRKSGNHSSIKWWAWAKETKALGDKNDMLKYYTIVSFSI